VMAVQTVKEGKQFGLKRRGQKRVTEGGVEAEL